MFKLRHSTTSPFVRKVRVTAAETGQEKDIELVKTNPADLASGIGRDNPLNKVPALVLEDGSSLYDSCVICEFLDERHQGRKLFPKPGLARWAALRRMALADGMVDAAILRMQESRRPENLRWAEWDQKQKLKVQQGLDALEREASGFGDTVDIGTLTVAIMLDYLNFRFKAENWPATCPNLAKWHAKISQRPSLQSTVPFE